MKNGFFRRKSSQKSSRKKLVITFGCSNFSHLVEKCLQPVTPEVINDHVVESKHWEMMEK